MFVARVGRQFDSFRFGGITMATEAQVQAKRANAQKQNEPNFASRDAAGGGRSGPVAQAPYSSTVPSFQDFLAAPAPDDLPGDEMCKTNPILTRARSLPGPIMQNEPNFTGRPGPRTPKCAKEPNFRRPRYPSFRYFSIPIRRLSCETKPILGRPTQWVRHTS
jgi:hypothetical protein